MYNNYAWTNPPFSLLILGFKKSSCGCSNYSPFTPIRWWNTKSRLTPYHKLFKVSSPLIGGHKNRSEASSKWTVKGTVIKICQCGLAPRPLINAHKLRLDAKTLRQDPLFKRATVAEFWFVIVIDCLPSVWRSSSTFWDIRLFIFLT